MAASTAMSAGTRTSLSVIVYGKYSDLRMRNTATHYANDASKNASHSSGINTAGRGDARCQVWSLMQDHTYKAEAHR